MAKAAKKGCGSQLSGEDRIPAQDWQLLELSDYAKAEYSAIQEREESLAVMYWRLGHALTLARELVMRGRWRPYLEELGIEKTRSSKAMAIHRTFPQIEDVAGMTVDAAYEKRTRKMRTRRGRTATDADGCETLPGFLAHLREKSDDWLREAACIHRALGVRPKTQ